jgi:hypothetical protein
MRSCVPLFAALQNMPDRYAGHGRRGAVHRHFDPIVDHAIYWS